MVNIILAVIQWTLIIAIRLPLFLIGLVITPIALKYEINDFLTQQYFSQYEKGKAWWWIGLPNWAWIWSNDRDGAKGDKRGWWHTHAVFEGGSDAFWNKWWWLAVRNPVNNMRFCRGISVNMRDAKVKKLAGQDYVHTDDDGSGMGWQWLVAEGPIFKYFSFYWVSQEYPDWFTKVIPWFEERVFTIRLGHKIMMKHNDQYYGQDLDEDMLQKAWKGFTFRINPFLKYKE